MRISALAALIWMFNQSTALALERSVVLAGMNVTVWSKEADKAGKQPVIIFSHGFHGCATQSRFLTDALASAGYLVFAPNHLEEPAMVVRRDGLTDPISHSVTLRRGTKRAVDTVQTTYTV